MIRTALVIAVVGAESTGKTWLAQALSEHLARSTGLRCTWVPEWLRLWCDAQGRTPARHEQFEIGQTQQTRIAAAAQAHDIVVADTTALMTAVYSLQVFGDESLLPFALEQHQRVQLTQAQLPFMRVSGLGTARLDCAARACESALQDLLRHPIHRGAPKAGQLTASEPGG